MQTNTKACEQGLDFHLFSEFLIFMVFSSVGTMCCPKQIFVVCLFIFLTMLNTNAKEL